MILLITIAATALSHRPPIARRFFLTSTASFGIAARALAAAPGPVLAISVDDARSQWAAACQATDRLLSDWDTLSSGGDAVRRELGTVGTSSPLFQLNKAVRVLQDEASDPIEWGENLEELLLSLGRADSMAYSSNFAGGSGKQSEVSKDAMLAKAEREVRAMRDAERKMGAAL